LSACYIILNPKRSRLGAFLRLGVVIALLTPKGFRFSYSYLFSFTSSFVVSFISGSTVKSAVESTIEFAISCVRCGSSVETKASHFSLKELAIFSTPSFT